MTARPNRSNDVPRVRLQLRATVVVRDYVRQLLETGLYGSSESAVLERLIEAQLMQLVADGSLTKIRYLMTEGTGPLRLDTNKRLTKLERNQGESQGELSHG